MKNKDIGVSCCLQYENWLKILKKLVQSRPFNYPTQKPMKKNSTGGKLFGGSIALKHCLSMGMNKNFNRNINSIIWMVNIINKLSLSELLIVTTFCDLTLE